MDEDQIHLQVKKFKHLKSRGVYAAGNYPLNLQFNISIIDTSTPNLWVPTGQC